MRSGSAVERALCWLRRHVRSCYGDMGEGRLQGAAHLRLPRVDPQWGWIDVK